MPWLWTLLVLGLLALHAQMTLRLFGSDDSLQRLTDEQPIVSGRHPLHLYHGYLSARSFLATGKLSCYDPAFQAGYLQTSVFDSGSRPAGLFLLIAGGSFDPAAYKVGLAVCCLLVPLLVIIACWGAGFGPAPTCLATTAALLVWWGTPSRQTLEAGDIDLLLAALAILAHAGLLIHFDKQPGFFSWLGMLLTGCLGWFVHPMLFLLVLPIALVYYLSAGIRHALTTWHLTLILSELGAMAINGFWLVDWMRHWWLRSPLPASDGMLLHRTFATLWSAPQWGDAADRVLDVVLLGSAAVGVVLLNQTQQRVAARLLGMGAGGLWLLAILGISWEPLGQIGTSALMVPALWFAALPAAYAWTRAYRALIYLVGSPLRGALVTCGLLAVLAFVERDLLASFAERRYAVAPLAMGLSPEREALVETLKRSTTAEGRILWEDLHTTSEAQRWPVLLPLLTGRTFIGGLDPNGMILHSRTGLIDQVLCGSPLSLWTDAELASYCGRFNIGWIVCRSTEAASRFRAWQGAQETAQVDADGPAYLFTIVKPSLTFVIKGQARVLHMDSHHITLADVVPDGGIVVLSLHFQTGMRATPEQVTVQAEPDPAGKDVIPCVELRLERPVTRVTLMWQGR